jgi:hypothetical protein
MVLPAAIWQQQANATTGINAMPGKMTRMLAVAAGLAALMLLAAAILSGAARAAAATPSVTAAWIRLPLLAGRPAAAYATIRGGDRADRLIAVEGPKPARFELHATRNEAGVIRMIPQGEVVVPARGTVQMKPGGLHVMIFGLPETKPGATVPLTFVFASAGRMPVLARAMAATDEGHAHH